MAENTATKKSAFSQGAPAGGARGSSRGSFGSSPRGGQGGGRGQGGPRKGGNFERVKPEYDQKILAIRRVTRVVSGGRRMTFSVAMVIGDRKGLIGLGTGKAIDTSIAITKAQKDAKKNMLKLKLTKTQSLPHDISAKFGSSNLMLMPNRGRGLISGSAVRDILLLAGIKDVTTKIHSGSKNKLNNARATMKALSLVGTKVMRHVVADEKLPKVESVETVAEVK
ncbi:MAG: 30S ribosomal protein S5 [bacterium]